MAEQAKAGQIGAGRRPVGTQHLRASLVGHHHGAQGRIYPAASGGVARMGGKQRARAHGLGQQQHVAGLHAAFAHHACHVLVNQAIDGKAQRQFLPLAGVATHQGAACCVQHLHGAAHHLGEQVLDLAL